MGMRAYIFGNAALILGVFMIPGIEDVIRVYVVSVVVLISVLFNILMAWGKLRGYVINKLYIAVLTELLMDPDIRKIIGLERITNLINKAQVRAKETDASHTP